MCVHMFMWVCAHMCDRGDTGFLVASYLTARIRTLVLKTVQQKL